jgi:hypothetical protein
MKHNCYKAPRSIKAFFFPVTYSTKRRLIRKRDRWASLFDEYEDAKLCRGKFWRHGWDTYE